MRVLLCRCGLPVVVCETKRATANFGWRFYRCSNYQSKLKCFFAWIDEPHSSHVEEVKRNSQLKTVEGKSCEEEVQKSEVHFEDTTQVTVIRKIDELKDTVNQMKLLLWSVLFALVIGMWNRAWSL